MLRTRGEAWSSSREVRPPPAADPVEGVALHEDLGHRRRHLAGVVDRLLADVERLQALPLLEHRGDEQVGELREVLQVLRVRVPGLDRLDVEREVRALRILLVGLEALEQPPARPAGRAL